MQTIYSDMAYVIGILQQPRESAGGADAKLTEDLMQLIISIRQQARKEKNWAVADQIRDQLNAIGILLEDSPQGVKWKRQ